jgi:hypothetical protein
MNETLSRPYPGAPLTVILPCLKWRVLAREDDSAVTYSNAYQANLRANFLNAPHVPGTGAVLLAPLPESGAWVVRQGPSSRVFCVCWDAAPVDVRDIEPAETAFEVTERALAAEEACADWSEVL